LSKKKDYDVRKGRESERVTIHNSFNFTEIEEAARLAMLFSLKRNLI